MIFALRLRICCTYAQYHLTTFRYYIVCKARGNNILFQTWRNMMTLNPNLRKIICLVTVDFVCLLLVGVPCLLLWLVGKWLVLQGKRILKHLIRRSVFPWILLWRWNSAAPLQRLHCSNMGTHCCQLRTANYCVQVGGLQNWKERKLCSFSLVETSRLKRSATFNWTRFLRWSSQPEHVELKVFFSKDIKLKFLSAEISMESLASLFLGPWSPNFWLTQASTQLVSIHIIWEIWKSFSFSPSGRLRPHFLTVCRPNVTLTSTEVSSSVWTNSQTWLNSGLWRRWSSHLCRGLWLPGWGGAWGGRERGWWSCFPRSNNDSSYW